MGEIETEWKKKKHTHNILSAIAWRWAITIKLNFDLPWPHTKHYNFVLSLLRRPLWRQVCWSLGIQGTCWSVRKPPEAPGPFTDCLAVQAVDCQTTGELIAHYEMWVVIGIVVGRGWGGEWRFYSSLTKSLIPTASSKTGIAQSLFPCGNRLSPQWQATLISDSQKSLLSLLCYSVPLMAMATRLSTDARENFFFKKENI